MFKNIKSSYFFLFFLFLATLPYCYLSFFAQPIADDFIFANYFQENNFYELLNVSYFKINGRYISNILIYLNPISFSNILGYKLVPFLMIILLMIGNNLLVKKIFYFLSNTSQLIISLMLSLLFLQNMPIISEGLYWYTGAIIYLGGIICAVFYIAFFIKIITDRNKKGLFGKILLSSLLFCVCGFNEVLMLIIVFFLFLATIISYLNQKEETKEIFIQFLFSLLFAGILIFSPGNFSREATYVNNNNFSYSFEYSLLQIVRFTAFWVFSLALISASILYYPIHQKWKEKSLWLSNSFYLKPWVSVTILFSIIFICVFPAYWATGILGQHRTLNVAYFFFLLMWFINLSIWFNYYKKLDKIILSKKIINVLSILFLVGIMFMGNGYNALSDIFYGKAQLFNNQLNKRNEILFNAMKNPPPKIILSPITAKPKTLFVLEISEDSKFWTNQAYNSFFRLDSTEIYVE